MAMLLGGRVAEELIFGDPTTGAANDIERVTVIGPPVSHMEPDAPQFLNVLRICDIPDALGCLAPKRLTLTRAPVSVAARVKAIYAAAGAAAALKIE